MDDKDLTLIINTWRQLSTTASHIMWNKTRDVRPSTYKQLRLVIIQAGSTPDGAETYIERHGEDILAMLKLATPRERYIRQGKETISDS